MPITNLKRVAAGVLAAGLLTAGSSLPTALAKPAPEERPLGAETFSPLHRQIKPQPGEARWMDIPWLTDLQQARQKAATEGKPLFLMASGSALSIGMC